MKKNEPKKERGAKRLFASRVVLLIFSVFIAVVLIANGAESDDIMLLAGIQLALFVCSFFSLQLTGTILIIESLVIGVYVIPIRHYGLFALSQCILFLVIPPLLAGICFLNFGIKQAIASNQSSDPT
jgi:hypothetical protein